MKWFAQLAKTHSIPVISERRWKIAKLHRCKQQKCNTYLQTMLIVSPVHVCCSSAAVESLLYHADEGFLWTVSGTLHSAAHAPTPAPGVHTHTHTITHTHACMRTHTHTQMTDCDLDGWQYEDSVLFMIQLLGLVPWTQIQWFSMDNQLISTKMLLFCPSLLPDLKCAQLCHFNSPPTVAAALTQDLWPDLQGTQPSPPHLSPLFQG